MIASTTLGNSQVTGRELRDLLFSHYSRLDLLTVLHSVVLLGFSWGLKASLFILVCHSVIHWSDVPIIYHMKEEILKFNMPEGIYV